MFKNSLKRKIIFFQLIPIILIIIFVSELTIYLIDYYVMKLAQNKVQYDLNSAHEIYNNEIEKIKNVIRFSSRLSIISNSIVTDNLQKLLAEIQRIRVDEHLDFLTVTDNRGYVILRARNPEQRYDYEGNDIFVKKSLIGEIIAGTQILDEKELKKEGKDLAEIAYTKIIETPKAIPSKKKIETSGMVIKASAPIYDSRYRLIGVIYGGILLNKNFYIVDKIKRVVFGNKDIGTATIFMGDLRISTNVKMRNGKRAVGTRLSKEVFEKVILNGQKWIDRAFVVNSWYITAYEPIFDPENNIIGSLYVGILEKPFIKIKYNIAMIFITILIIISSIVFILSLIFSKKIIEPIQSLEAKIKKVAKGNYEEFVEITSNDEIGRVEQEFNNMIKNLKEKEQALNKLYLDLEDKVKKRTEELEKAKNELTEANKQLQEYLNKYRDLQAELVHSSKLAAIGALASGVAHEINNPIAIIRGNLEVLEMYLAEKGLKNTKEMDLIKQQVIRVQRIIEKLLSISKKKDVKIDKVNINKILKDICEPLQKENEILGIEINLKLDDIPEINSFETQIREVILNILLNAIEAVKAKGKGYINVKTKYLKNENKIEITIEDSGIGIDEEDMKNIFKPFFSTKVNGTGLGLPISYSIIKQIGGELKIESIKDKGTTVKIILPCK